MRNQRAGRHANSSEGPPSADTGRTELRLPLGDSTSDVLLLVGKELALHDRRCRHFDDNLRPQHGGQHWLQTVFRRTHVTILHRLTRAVKGRATLRPLQ